MQLIEQYTVKSCLYRIIKQLTKKDLFVILDQWILIYPHFSQQYLDDF